MKKLNAVAIPPSYISIFEAIRDRKHDGATKTALVDAEAAIENRFRIYEHRYAGNTLETIPPSTLKHISIELRSCYGNNKRMNELKEAIREAQPKGSLTWCPYCGATTPGSHDHYLPAEKFPEFAAHALNLVPACGRCNSIKNDDWLQAGSRQYLHFYLDAVPAFPFLTVNLTSDPMARAVGANFAIQRAGMPAADWALIELHFRKLKLIDLYDSFCNDLITLYLRSARSHIRDGGRSAATFLANEAADNSDLYGGSGWRSVLQSAMSNHPDLDLWIDWL